MRLIVIPELKGYYRKLVDHHESQPGFLERECKLSGISIHTENKLEKLVAQQEYKIRKILKSKLKSELLSIDEHSSKDIQMNEYLLSVFRKSFQEIDESIRPDQILAADERKQLLDKAIQDIIQDNVKIRGSYVKIQQSLMQIDENEMDGKEI